MSEVISRVRGHLLTTVHTCLKLLGHMAVCTYVVRHAWLHLRLLQEWLVSVYIPNRHNLDRMIRVPVHIRSSLDWWLSPESVLEGVPFVAMAPSLILVSEALDQSWELTWASSAHKAAGRGTICPST